MASSLDKQIKDSKENAAETGYSNTHLTSNWVRGVSTNETRKTSYMDLFACMFAHRKLRAFRIILGNVQVISTVCETELLCKILHPCSKFVPKG